VGAPWISIKVPPQPIKFADADPSQDAMLVWIEVRGPGRPAPPSWSVPGHGSSGSGQENEPKLGDGSASGKPASICRVAVKDPVGGAHSTPSNSQKPTVSKQAAAGKHETQCASISISTTWERALGVKASVRPKTRSGHRDDADKRCNIMRSS
jgi:hypothetical protein